MGYSGNLLRLSGPWASSFHPISNIFIYFSSSFIDFYFLIFHTHVCLFWSPPPTQGCHCPPPSIGHPLHPPAGPSATFHPSLINFPSIHPFFPPTNHYSICLGLTHSPSNPLPSVWAWSPSCLYLSVCLLAHPSANSIWTPSNPNPIHPSMELSPTLPGVLSKPSICCLW